MEDIPIVIYHVNGVQQYFINCVNINSLKNKVYIIGDDSNKNVFINNPNVEHISNYELYSTKIDEFKNHFVNYSSNSINFELDCFLRFFYLKELIQKKNLNRILHLDSDCIVFDNATELFAKLSQIKIGYSIQTFSQKKNPYHMVGCIHNALLNFDFCMKYIELCFDIYVNKSKFNLIDPKINWHQTHIGGVCDMTLLYLFFSTNIMDKTLTNFNDIFIIDGELSSFDHNINDSYGFEGAQTYLMENNIKKIIKKNNYYYAETNSNKYIRLLSIHFQGAAKNILSECLY
jgi:hypothetical protein